MPFLIDGNNLLFAMRKAGSDIGRGGLCRLLGDLAQRSGHRVRLVFDGPAPAGLLAEQIRDPRIEMTFSAPTTADEVILEAIAANSAPRRLTVVSSDRELRVAARRRRCIALRSEEFLIVLEKLAQPRPARPAEPQEKYRGLASEQSDAWLKEFGIAPIKHDEQDDLDDLDDLLR